MAFCGKCGASLNGGRFCQKCGSPIEDKVETKSNVANVHKKSLGSKKVVLSALVVAVVVIAGGIFLFHPTVNEPCDWCGDRPSVAYKTSQGRAYVCRDCSKDCAFCNKRATKHYENMLGTVVFVCSDCYKDVTEN